MCLALLFCQRKAFLMARSLRLLTITSLLVLAIGVGFYSVRQWANPSGAKSIDSYWAATGLESQALEELLEPGHCQTSRQYFLACVGAVNAVAQALGQSLEPELESVRMVSISQEDSEREILSRWSRFYDRNPGAINKVDFLELWAKLRENSPRQQQARLVALGLNGFLSVLKDPHTYIIPIDYYREVVVRGKNRAPVVGISLGRDGDQVFIRRVLEGSLAERQGLKKGDWLTEINGVKISGKPMASISELLKGPEGEKISLTVRRQGQTKTYSFVKEVVTIPSVTSKVLAGVRPLGVLTINKFAVDTCSDVKSQVLKLREQKIRGMLLDLRDNPGGQMDEAACVASLFLGPKKKVFELRYLDPKMEVEHHYGSEEQIYSGPIAVLINSGSASAAEIVAGSLRDYNRSILVGERTFGKGSFQEGEIWAENSNIALFKTKGFYYLPTGLSPQKIGLEPDITVAFRGTDSQREEDQYFNALSAPAQKGWFASRPLVNWDSCFLSDATASEDLEVETARQGLLCSVANLSGEGL